jgi:hypothetical protein
LEINDSDFQSLDVNLATIKRNPDGSIPVTNLFRLSPKSNLIDIGIDTGLPFSGNAPDLGSFESVGVP